MTMHRPSPNLVDRYGRSITYLRMSVTDRCDFRCSYCMAEDMEFLHRQQVMSLEQCFLVAKTFAELGVRKIRVTGGEPLVRKNVIWLLSKISALPGIDELVLTTNGSQLVRFAIPLRDAGVKRINISLDSLREDRFRQITRIGDLGKVLGGIAAARDAGFVKIKLNVVMMLGINDDEFVDLTQFAVDQGLDISFIEEMPLGSIGGREGRYISSDVARRDLIKRFELVPSAERTGGPARYWRVASTQTRIGFISPYSHNFCDSCNRVRVTAKGELYPCLGQNDALDLAPLLRSPENQPGALRQAIIDGMGIKPFGHNFVEQIDSPAIVRFMSVTGG